MVPKKFLKKTAGWVSSCVYNNAGVRNVLPGSKRKAEEKARADCIQKLQAYSLLYSPIPVSADDQLLLLVTCEGAEESRRIVAARRLREGETEQTLSSLLPYARKR